MLASCLLSLDCSGTFCDAYPEACGAAEGGGGSGGAPPALIDVAVSLVDVLGEPVPGAIILISEPDGRVFATNDTPVGARTVSVPVDGYVSVFQTVDARDFAFTAAVSSDVSALTFRLPVQEVESRSTNITVSVDCQSDCEGAELSGSCFDPILATPGNPLTFDIPSYVDCRGDGVIDLFAVGYSTIGFATSATTKTASVGSTIQLLSLTSLDVDETVSLSMKTEGEIGVTAIRRAVRVPYMDGRGFGFSRSRTGLPTSMSLSVPKAYVPRADAQFFVDLTDGRQLFRQEWFESFGSEATSTFALTSLAIPAVPSSPEESGSTQPTALYSVDDGAPGDAVQLRVLDSDVEWAVTLSWDGSGAFRFPDLPDDLARFKLGSVDAYEVMAVDRDNADSYTEFVSQPIYSHARQHGVESVTVASSKTP